MKSKRTVVSAALISVAILGGADAAGPHAWSIESVTRDSVGDRGRTPLAAREQPRMGSTWCGTPSQVDVTPNAVAGYATHWIYATPSDGADNFATFASAMETDAESVDAWWRSHDAVRAPRNDLARLSCGLQLDLTQIRLSASGYNMSDDDVRFFAIAESLVALGFRDPHTKYVVYYDGPGHPDICGQGGSHEDGYGYAIVYVQACAGVPFNTTAAHELLHTLGAVPAGAPNDCPYPHDGHVCDDPYDLMFPFADETPITSLGLDTGRDDYYGHAGAQLDVQDSPWLVQLDRQVPLALSISGTGSVTGDLPGLRCNQSCTTTWNADTTLLLKAQPAAGSKLVRWGSGCAGASECSLRLSQPTNVSVVFAPLEVKLKVAVSGRGTVRGPQSGISCPGRCTADVPSYEPIRLTAKPVKGWRFKSWSGSCRGRALVCTLPMTASSSARAVFVRAS